MEGNIVVSESNQRIAGVVPYACWYRVIKDYGISGLVSVFVYHRSEVFTAFF